MNTSLKKLLIITLVLTLALVCFVGCGEETPEATVAPTETPIATTAPVATYTVSFLSGEGTGDAPSSITLEAGETFTVPENDFTRTGYAFYGYWTGWEYVFAGDSYVMKSQDMTFTAQYTASASSSSGGGGGGGGSSSSSTTTTMSAPSATITDSTISWTGITGATSYIITIDGETFETTATSFDVISQEAITATVKATSTSSSYNDSSATSVAVSAFEGTSYEASSETLYVVGEITTLETITSSKDYLYIESVDETSKISTTGTLTINAPTTHVEQNVPITADSMIVSVSDTSYIQNAILTITNSITINTGKFVQNVEITATSVVVSDGATFEVPEDSKATVTPTLQVASTAKIIVSIEISITIEPTVSGQEIDLTLASGISPTITVVGDYSATINLGNNGATIINNTTQTITVINSDGSTELSAGQTSMFDIITVQLETPTVEIANGKISWTAVDNADSYIVYVNDEAVAVEDLEYIPTQDGILQIQVVAVGDAVAFSNSENSTMYEVAVSFESANTATLDTLYILSDINVSVDVVIDASQDFEIVGAGESDVSITTTGTFTIKSSYSIEQNVSIKAVSITIDISGNFKQNAKLETTGDAGIVIINGYFIQYSEIITIKIDLSATATYELPETTTGITETPVLYAHTNTTINIYIDINIYIVAKEADAEITINTAEAIPTVYVSGEYKVTIVVSTDDILVYNNSTSEIIVQAGTITINVAINGSSIQELASPTVTIANGKISWTAVDNADSYIVYVNGVEIEVSGTEYTPTQDGVLQVTVQAVSDKIKYSSSSKSTMYEVAKTLTAENTVTTGTLYILYDININIDIVFNASEDFEIVGAGAADVKIETTGTITINSDITVTQKVEIIASVIEIKEGRWVQYEKITADKICVESDAEYELPENANVTQEDMPTIYVGEDAYIIISIDIYITIYVESGTTEFEIVTDATETINPTIDIQGATNVNITISTDVTINNKTDIEITVTIDGDETTVEAGGTTIPPTPITITGITATSKTYDGKTSVELSAYSQSDVTFTAVFADKNVGEDKEIVFTTVSKPYNTVITYPEITADITSATITIGTPTVSEKEYDGTTTATVTVGTISGLIDGDDVSVSATGTYDSASVGEDKTVVVTYEWSGDDIANYTLPELSETLENQKIVVSTTVSYTLSFQSNGGSDVSSITVYLGEEIASVLSPTKDEYYFAGWYTDEDLTTKATFPITISKNTTLYAKWEEYVATDGLEFTLSNGEYTVSGYSGSDVDVIIPSAYSKDGVNYYPVTSIRSTAFYRCTGIESITIPDSITSIGSSAFQSCSSIKSITIPDSVTSIGSYAFGECSSLKNITIPEGITIIESQTFYECKNLESITIPERVTSIGYGAFGYCTSLKSITIPNGVTIIESFVFQNCTSLESIIIPDGLTNIEESAFNYCRSLESITIPSSVESIASIVFSSCTSLENINVSSENKTYRDIDGNLFNKDGTTLIQYAIGKTDETYIIPDGVTSIESSAFSGCENIESVVITEGVTSIGKAAFFACDSLTSITIPESVISIGDYAFYYCESLESITIPDGVTTIGNQAFYNCTNLTIYAEILENDVPDGWSSNWNYSNCTVYWGLGVTWEYDVDGNPIEKTETGSGSDTTDDDSKDLIGTEGLIYTLLNGEYSVTDYEGTATDVIIPTTYAGEDGISYPVTSIGEDAFYECTSLESITISESVTSIGVRAFSFCTSLENIFVSDDNIKYKDIDGNLFSIDGTELIQYAIAKTDTVYTIPEGVTSIGYYAFYYCISLESITILEGVTDIGDGAFYRCTSLESITIPESVTSIGTYAFNGCTSLESVTIPYGITSIYWGAFQNCTSLKSITIPESVTSIGTYAFYGCTNLVSITIPDGLTSIGKVAFNGCTSLESITIPSSVESIGAQSFYNCTSLESIIIPYSVTSIDTFAFGDCNNLIIYAEVESQPSGWSSSWDSSWDSSRRTVYWRDEWSLVDGVPTPIEA